MEAYSDYNREMNSIHYSEEDFKKMDSNTKKMLSPKTFSFKRYKYLRKMMDPMILNANYHQKTFDKENFLYDKFDTYTQEDIKDLAFDRIAIRLDPAGDGSDYFVYMEYGEKMIGDTNYAYIFDMYMSNEAYKKVIEEVALRIGKSKASVCHIEGNRGGEAIRESLANKVKLYGNPGIKFNIYSEKENKEAKIKLYAHIVNERIKMPERWEENYSNIYNHVSSFQRVGKNAHDDPEDVLSNIARDLLSNQGGYDHWIRRITIEDYL
jgi:predicted phage terminase large subunit-like protein